MAKRFIDTNIFRKNFMRGLSAPEKLLWIYLFCDCSHAGIWEIDLEIAGIYTGSKLKLEDFKKFGERIIIFDNDKKIFIPEFIEFQYGQLKENNNAHLAVIRDLRKYGFINENLQIINLQVIEGLVRGSGAPMDKDKDKEKDKEMEMEMEKGGVGEKPKPSKKPEFDFSFVTNGFAEAFYKWLEYKKGRKESYKTQDSLEACYKNLIKLSGNDHAKAMEIVLHNMAQNYAGMFPIKENHTKKVTHDTDY